MKQENFNTVHDSKGKSLSEAEAGLRKPRILVAPLDWGLGHATRCIPVIYELLRQDCDVWLAGEGMQEALLKQEFPGLPFLSLPGYRVKYGRSGGGMLWNLLRQSGKILRTIKDENSWLKRMADEHGFDAVISDNRYGLYHSTIPCIFITHQLTIKTAFGKWTEKILQKRNYKYINRFTECWVPDEKGENNLAGELSHPGIKPRLPLKYVGHLSRLENTNDLTQPHLGLPDVEAGAGGLLVILSGPEPQRSILENKIINEIAQYPGTATIARGLPGAANLVPSTNTIRFYNHLPSEELNKEMMEAEYVISRSGYSTIMDIIKLGKKSILIPTPGQTEQEYLSKYLQEKKIAVSISQKNFSISSALKSAKSFAYVMPETKKTSLQQVIAQFIQSLRKD